MPTHEIEATARIAASRWGAEGAHIAGAADAVDGHQPRVVLEPGDAATAASMPQATYTRNLARFTGTPDRRAASSLPPMA